jgi:hypothetical protein
VEGTADNQGRRRWSYAELLADSERVARVLLGRFAPGERAAAPPSRPPWSAGSSPRWVCRSASPSRRSRSRRGSPRARLGDSPEDRAATLGRAHPHVEVMIADPGTGQLVPAGPIGEILTRGYHLMREYLDNPRRPVGRSRPTAGCAPETSARPTSAGTAGSRAGSRRRSPRREDLSAGDRAGPVRPPASGRRGGRGRARRAPGRAGGRLHQGCPRPDRDR